MTADAAAGRAQVPAAGAASSPSSDAGLPSDPGAPPDPRVALGARGESLAARWYEAHGYEVLERNWRRREGEIDLIVRRGPTVVVCEVKVRSSDRFGTGAEAVPVAKQRRIRRLATRWLTERAPGDPVELRFDVVSVTAGRIEVIEDAF